MDCLPSFEAGSAGLPDLRPLTHHGRARLQGRAIDPRAVEHVIAFGREQRVHGASRFWLDRAGRRRLERALGDAECARLGHKLDIAVVVGDDARLVTAMYRTRRIRH